MQTSLEDRPRIKFTKLGQIVDHEMILPDTVNDIENKRLPRRELWRSAFTLGFAMGNLRITDSKDLP